MAKRLLNPTREVAGDRQNMWCYLFSPACQKEGLLTSSPQPSSLLFLSLSGCLAMGGMEGGQSKNTSLGCMPKNFKKGFNGDYRVKLTPDKLRNFCEIDWPAFGVEWPLKRSLDKVIVNRAFEVGCRVSGHPDQFHDIDCWQDSVPSWPMWLKSYLEEAGRGMVARMAAASKCREKCKKPEKLILAGP
jgi:hypothetical protein